MARRCRSGCRACRIMAGMPWHEPVGAHPRRAVAASDGSRRMADDLQHFLPPVAPQGTHNPVFGVLRRTHSLHLHLARVGIQGGQPAENMVVRTRPTADRVPHGDSRLCADRLLLDSVHHCRRRHSAVGILALQPHPAATPFFLI